MSVPQASQPIQIRPIINYPREAQIGQTYLMTIDVQLASPDASWPYPDEEYPITFILNTQPYFRYEPLNGEREPGIVLHRFGGTYGPAQYLLTASEQEVERGHISITFLNGWGLPVTYLELECVVKAELVTGKEREITVLSKEKAPVVPQTSLAAEKKLPYEEAYSSQETVEETDSPQEVFEVEMIRLDLIMEQLKQTGWTLYQFSDQELLHYFTDRDRSEGIAVTSNLESSNGYFLFVAGRPIGTLATTTVLKSFPEEPTTTEALISVMQSLLNISISHTGYNILPFTYEITNTTIRFTNYLEPEPQSRRVFTFHRPETLARWLEQAPPNVPAAQTNLLRSRLQRMPTLQRKGLRRHQFEAISNLESSLALNNRHALLQMETGTGVTFAALNIIHRLLKYGGARRILYALDTPIPKDYVIDTLQTFVPANATANSINLYDTDYMRGNRPDPGASVCIATLEQLHSSFQVYPSENLFPSNTLYPAASENGNINYNSTFPIEYFDVIIIANCDSHLYRQWQPFIEYFDTFFVGIKEDANEQLLSLFDDNLAYEQEIDLPRAAIFTAIPLEYQAVRAYLTNLQEMITTRGIVYEQGEFFANNQKWEVIVVATGAGTTQVATMTAYIIGQLKPQVVMFVGIAGGIKNVKLGDVVVASQVYSAEIYDLRSGRIEPFFQRRPQVYRPTFQILRKARVIARKSDWHERLKENPTASNEVEAPDVIIAPIVSGNQVVASTDAAVLQLVRSHFKDALAIEMEGFGFLESAHLDQDIEALIIRGISDLIDNQSKMDKQQYQRIAANRASAFAFEVLANLEVEGGAKLDAELSTSSTTTAPDTTGNFEIFYAYAREDAALVQRLQSHLAVLIRQGDNTAWDESKIMPGQEWEREIERHLNTARVILVFISANLLASEWFSSLPWQHMLERQRAGEVTIIPIVLRPTYWENTPFSQLRSLPYNGKPVSSYRSTDRAFVEIAQEVMKVVERLRASSA